MKNFNALMLLFYPTTADILPCLKDTLKRYIDIEKSAHELTYKHGYFTYCYYVFICNRYLNLIYSAFPQVNKNNILELLERVKKENV